MLNVSIELVASTFAILGILVTAIVAVIRISNRTVISLNNINNALGHQTAEIIELKGYKKDIDQNKKDIQELQLQKVDEGVFNAHVKEFTELKTAHEIHHTGGKT